MPCPIIFRVFLATFKPNLISHLFKIVHQPLLSLLPNHRLNVSLAIFFLLLVLLPSKFLFPWQLQFLIVNVLLSDPVLGRFGFNSTIGSLFLGPVILLLLFLSLNRFFLPSDFFEQKVYGKTPLEILGMCRPIFHRLTKS